MSAVARGLFVGNPWSLDVSGGFASPLAAELIGAADLIVGWGLSIVLDDLLPPERVVAVDSGNFMGYPSRYLLSAVATWLAGPRNAPHADRRQGHPRPRVMVARGRPSVATEPAQSCQVTLLVPHPRRTAVLVAAEKPSEASTPPMLPTVRMSSAEPSLPEILASIDVVDTATTAALRLVTTSPSNPEDRERQ